MLRRLLIPIALALMTVPAFAADTSPPDPSSECDTVSDMAKDPIIEKEIFHVAGDAPDPTRETSAQGLAPGYQLTQSAAGHPQCLYRFGNVEMLVEIDVYRLEGQPMYLHLLCPHCMAREHAERNALRVSAERKQMSYEATSPVPIFPGWTERQMRSAFPKGPGGLLNVQTPFQCSWEVNPKIRERVGNVCDFKVVIENNVMRAVSRGAAGVIYGGAIR